MYIYPKHRHYGFTLHGDETQPQTPPPAPPPAIQEKKLPKWVWILLGVSVLYVLFGHKLISKRY
jgi:hypothetical protein